MNQNLLNIMALFQGHIPFRHHYYRLFYKPIMNGIRKKALLSLNERDLITIIRESFLIEKGEIEKVSELEQKNIVQEADKIMDNVFNYLGSGDKVLSPVCWDTDFISGYKWSQGLYYKKYVQVSLDNHADVKLPRELSRSHFLLHLALAYVFTGDDKYANKAVSLIEEWIDNNPFLHSINWCCAMDVAIRAVNWLWALAILKDYALDRNKSEKIAISLYQHGWYIFRNLEGNRLTYNGNHYYSDLVGLLHLGLLFKKDAEGSFWFSFGEKELFREMRLQVLPSGMHYEGSTNYHRLVLELTLPCISLLKKNGQVVPPDIDARLKSMFDIVKQLVMPNGEMPIIGDQDNGRCLPFGTEKINDYQYLLTLGAYLYEDSDAHNVYCALLKDLRTSEFSSTHQNNEHQKLALLKDAGFILYKDENWYCLNNIDNQGLYRDVANDPGHTHADWLSFVLAFKDIPLIIDPGTYVYSSNPERRNEFRSTSMHNTLTVDGKSQADVPQKQLWSLPRKKAPILHSCVYKNDVALLECENQAYSTSEEKVIHNRQFIISKEGVEIADTVVSEIDHHIDLYYYLRPQIEVEISGKKLSLKINEALFSLELRSSNGFVLEVNDCEVSNGYGSLTPTKCVHVFMEGKGMNVSTIIKKLD